MIVKLTDVFGTFLRHHRHRFDFAWRLSHRGGGTEMGRKDSGDDVSVRIGDVLAAFGFFVDDKIFEIIDIKGI